MWLSWSVVFFVAALISAVFGFTGIGGGAALVAKVLFFVFLLAYLTCLIVGIAVPRPGRGLKD